MKKKLLAVVLTVCMVATMMLVPAMAADEGTFTDVPSDHWASEAIERWAGYGILNGKDAEAGTFDPEGSMKRSEFAKVVVDLLGLPTEGVEMPFEDVIGSDADWAKGHIAAAYAAGIVSGTNAAGTMFTPNRAVKFEESAAMLSRALGLVEPGAYGEAVTEVLDELNMLDTLDDFVSGEADMNRAAVATLASNMIHTYVTPDTVDEVTEDGVITGEVNGIILVVGDVEVDIKGATVTAPIVVQGASVTLTGTTAADVKVGGESASVTADEESSVANVTVGGSDATVELNGEVTGSVTVAAEAEGELTLTVPESVDVAYNNTTDITVNGDTVEGTPAEEPEQPGEDEETPDEEQGESTGFVPTPSTPYEYPDAEDVVNSAGQTAAYDKAIADAAPAASKGELTEDDDSECDGNHTWGALLYTGKDESKPTCTTDGLGHYECSECNATSQVVIKALGHNYVLTAITKEATCTEKGTLTYTCTNGCTAEDEAHTKTETTPALGHHLVSVPAQAPTDSEPGYTAHIKCDREGCDYTMGKNVIPATDSADPSPAPSGTPEPTPTPTPTTHTHNYEWNKVVGTNGTHTLTCTSETGTCDTKTKAEDCTDANDDDKCDVCGADMSDSVS